MFSLQDVEVFLLVYVEDVIVVGNSRIWPNNITICITESFDICKKDFLDRIIGISCVTRETNVIIHSSSAVQRILNQSRIKRRSRKVTPHLSGTVLDKKQYHKSDGRKNREDAVPRISCFVVLFHKYGLTGHSLCH